VAWVAGGSQRFCIHKSLWVQENPGPFRTHFSVLCIESLLFREIRKEKREIACWQSGVAVGRLVPGLLGLFCVIKS
jgi:hypothetical protein